MYSVRVRSIPGDLSSAVLPYYDSVPRVFEDSSFRIAQHIVGGVEVECTGSRSRSSTSSSSSEAGRRGITITVLDKHSVCSISINALRGNTLCGYSICQLTI